MARQRRWPSDREVVAAVHRLAGDGYCPTHELFADSFRHVERRAVGKAIGRAANRGLILERRGPDGRRYLSIASEGWRLIETAA